MRLITRGVPAPNRAHPQAQTHPWRRPWATEGSIAAARAAAARTAEPSVGSINRPRAYNECACGRTKTRQAERCRTCALEVLASTRLSPEELHRRSFIHRANHAVRERMGREDMIPIDALLPTGPCHYCGAERPESWDHVTPLAAGGPNAVGNLVPCCSKCNQRKGARALTVFDHPEWMTLRCGFCGREFQRRSADLRKHQRRGGGSVFCGIRCRGAGQRALAATVAPTAAR